MQKVILCFSGRIGSGKTSLSSQVANILQWKYSSFGKIVRDEAVRKGVDYQDRVILQEVGKELINSGWENFCRAVLNEVDWKHGEGLVIDGIRHLEAITTLKKLVDPAPILLIYISLENTERYKRLEVRDSLTSDNLKFFEKDNTEVQVIELLPLHADLIIDGSQSLEISTREIISWFITL